MAASAEVVDGVHSRQNRGVVIWGLAALVLLSWTWFSNELLFHCLAGLLAVAAAVSVFVISWNSGKFAEDGFLLFLGTAYLGVATLDVLNTLAHPGMRVFDGHAEDAYRQLRVAASCLNGLALLIAPLFLEVKPRPWLVLASVGAVVAALVVSILDVQIFPYCGPAEHGVITFRRLSALAILVMLIGAMLHLRQVASRFDRRFCGLLLAAILMAFGAEMCFGFLDGIVEPGRSVSEAVNFLGHVFRVGSYFLVYRAVIETGLREPYGILFRRLRESETRFRVLVDEAPVAVALLNSDATFEYVNLQFTELFGYRLADLPDKSKWFELAYPDPAYRLRMAALWEEDSTPAAAPRSSRERIVCVRCRDGTTKTIRLKTSRLESGRQIASYEDITERRMAEQKLQASEERYRSLFSSMREAFALHEIILDEQGVPIDYRFLEVNEAFESMTGLRAGEIIGKTVLEVLPGVEPYWIEVYGQMALTGRPMIFEHYARALGKHFQVAASSPKPGQFSTIFLDITARKQAEDALTRSEERLKLALDIASDGHWDWNVPSGNVYFSPRYYSMLGCEPSELPVQWADWSQLLHPDDHERVVRGVERAMQAGEDAGALEFRLRRKDGSWCWILSRGRVVERDGEGKAVRVVGTHSDITERKKAEDEVKKYQLHLEELVEKRTRELEESREHLRRHERLASLGTLAAGIAHEINNPIGGILLAAQNVQRLVADPERRALVDACMQDIVDSAERCREIVQNLISFARHRPTRKTLCDLNACVHRSARLTEQYVWDLGGTLELDLSEHLPPVLLNPLAMEQVLVNLLRNAAESGNRGFQVRVRTELADKGVRVIVADNGRGISEDQLKHVFDPFFTTRLARGGTGLGLSIVHGIIKEQGGIIDVHSRLGSGTTFTIDLPLTVHDPGDGVHGEGSHC